jgi:hypothetical protein
MVCLLCCAVNSIRASRHGHAAHLRRGRAAAAAAAATHGAAGVGSDGTRQQWAESTASPAAPSSSGRGESPSASSATAAALHAVHAVEAEIRRQQASGLPPPIDFESTRRMVETAMLAAVAGLAYVLSTLLKLDAYFSYILPLPIVLAALRMGPTAATMVVTVAFLLLVGGLVGWGGKEGVRDGIHGDWGWGKFRGNTHASPHTHTPPPTPPHSVLLVMCVPSQPPPPLPEPSLQF